MSQLCLDNPFKDLDKEKESRENFEKVLDDYIENKYKSDESEELYSLFTDSQKSVLQNFFKSFSVEMYKELNGTVELQIEKKNAKVKEKVKRLSEYMGDINLDDWEYDGLVDSGKNASVKCDLCPRPIRYAHFAVNKKTRECLRFGCNCAADFFSIDKRTLGTMRTIQAKTLMDIKRIACVIEKNWFTEYYTYLCGHFGSVYLKDGIDGLKDLITFKVYWTKDKKLKGDELEDKYPINFGDNSNGYRSLDWIKKNIVSCINADLSDNIYDSIGSRTVVPKKDKDLSVESVNTAGYVKYAIKFIEVNLPVPLSLVRKINSIVSKVTRTHHPDFKKFANDLLISKNLEKSSLLRTAFTDFMVNYLASSLKIEERDPELASWKIRGPMTFIGVVHNWECMIIKLLALKEILSLEKDGYLSDVELRDFYNSNFGYSVSYDKFLSYYKKCFEMFISNKDVVVDKNAVENEISKYSILDNTTRLSLKRTGNSYNMDFTADAVPSSIGYFYHGFQKIYSQLVRETTRSSYRILKNIEVLSNDEDLLKYLFMIDIESNRGPTHYSNTYRYAYTEYSPSKIDSDFSEIGVPDDVFEKYKSKYLDKMSEFRESAKSLKENLNSILTDLRKFKLTKLPTVSTINDDYDSLNEGKEKTTRDSFIEYSNLLQNKRGTNRMQQYLKRRDLYSLIPYKLMWPYREMLKDIESFFDDKLKDKFDVNLYTESNLSNLKEILNFFTENGSIEGFVNIWLYYWVFNQTQKRYVYSEGISDNYDSTLYYDIRLNGKGPGVSDKAGCLSNYLLERLHKSVYPNVIQACIDGVPELRQLYDSLVSLNNQIPENKIDSLSFLNLFNDPMEKTRNKLNNFVTVSDLFQSIEYEDKVSAKYYNNPPSHYANIFKELSKYKGFENVDSKLISDIDEKIKTILEPILEANVELKSQKRDKEDLVNNIMTCLGEHSKFHEIDVDSLRKNNSLYSKKTDESIRRSVAFKKVVFEKGPDILPRFINELELYGLSNLSPNSDEYIQVAKTSTTKTDYTLYSEILRVELYNHNLILNHFSPMYSLYNSLLCLDLYSFDLEDLKDLNEICSRYYILKSNAERLCQIHNKYSSSSIDFSTMYNSLPSPKNINLKDRADYFMKKFKVSSTSDVDSNKTPDIRKSWDILKKVEKLREHSEFTSLPQIIQDITKTVTKSGKYSPKQSYRINQGIEMAYDANGSEIHISNDTDSLSTNSSKVVNGSNNSSDVSSTDSKILDPHQVELLDLCKKIKEHDDFSRLPTYLIKIVRSALQRKDCTPSMETHVLKAKQILNIL